MCLSFEAFIIGCNDSNRKGISNSSGKGEVTSPSFYQLIMNIMNNELE